MARIFTIRPRVARKGNLWLERKKARSRLADSLAAPGSHVCLDGPSGAGKTSLALTHVVTSDIKHVAVMLTGALAWPDFVRLLIQPPTNDELALAADFEFGIDKGLPVAKLRVSLGEKGRPSDDIDLATKTANSWTEHDVARRLAEKNAMLIIDDLERASEPLIARIADLCKVMTQAYVSDNAKILLIGSGDIYQRIYRANSALDERIEQVSLGAFKYPKDTRLLITTGFDKLGLRHPWNSEFPEQRDMRTHCERAIWEAADGLPKSINKLGRAIALRGENRKGINAHDILDEAARMANEHWIEYSQDFPEVLEYVEQEALAASLVEHLYENGIARIHKTTTIMAAIHRDHPDTAMEQLETVLECLQKVDFLVRTGKSGELVFVKHPTKAHTLGVAMRSPERFRTFKDLHARRPDMHRHFPLPNGDGAVEGEQPSEDS